MVRNARGWNKRLPNEQGVALVMVLWIFIFLSVVAANFSLSVREEGWAAFRYAEQTEGYYMALAGFQRGLYQLLVENEGVPETAEQEESPEVTGQLYGVWSDAVLRSGSYRIRLVDEGGKVNLNQANEQTLQRIFNNIGIEQPLVAILVDSIMDWRDQDDLHRVNGAEKEYYLSLANPYTPKDGPFDAVEDLLWVRGVSPELYYGVRENGIREVALRDIFTVDGRATRVNLRTATAEVIHALVGIPLAQSLAFVASRGESTNKTMSDTLGLLGLASSDRSAEDFNFAEPQIISIEAMGYAAGSTLPHTLRGVVRLTRGKQGYEVVRWQDWIMAPASYGAQ